MRSKNDSALDQNETSEPRELRECGDVRNRARVAMRGEIGGYQPAMPVGIRHVYVTDMIDATS